MFFLFNNLCRVEFLINREGLLCRFYQSQNGKFKKEGLPKMSDKIKKALPYSIVNLIGAALSMSSCFFVEMAFIGAFACVIPYAYCIYINPLALLIFAALNIAAFITVKKNKNAAGLTLSILYGFLGAFVGTFFNRNYTYTKAVRIIFNAHIWALVWGFCSVYYMGSHF